jgi:transposase-like protein
MWEPWRFDRRLAGRGFVWRVRHLRVRFAVMIYSVIFCAKCGSESVDVAGWGDAKTAHFHCHNCGHTQDVVGFTLGRCQTNATPEALEEARADMAVKR